MQQQTEIVNLQQSVNHTEYVERARALVPQLRKRINEIDEIKRLPEAIIKDLEDAGLLQLTLPHAYGGPQVSMQTLMDVTIELGRGDTSTAWVSTLLNSHWFVNIAFPEETQKEVFNTEGGARMSSAITPRYCKIKRVDGGYLVEEGKWGFNSGVYHANWDMLGIPLVNERGEVVGQGLALLPIKDVELLHDWNTIGLQGTGSTTVLVQNKFIPDHRVSSLPYTIEGHYASSKETAYHWALAPFLTLILTGPLLGAARAMLELFLEQLPNRGILYTWYTKQAEATLTHLQVADAAAKIDAAQLLMQRGALDIDTWADRAEYMPYQNRARVRMDGGYAARLLCEAADILVEAAGGSFAAAKNPLNRYWRDIHTGSLHAVLNPTTNQELYGRILCGQPANTPLI